MYDQLISLKPFGAVFELGCGDSGFVKYCADSNRAVGGIDYNEKSIKLLTDSIGIADGFFAADVFEFDFTIIKEKYDIIASFGFLEHFTNAHEIIEKSSVALKPGGIFISMVPNLGSVNGMIMKLFDRELWNAHMPISPEQLDRIHSCCKPVMRARYTGGFSYHMLIPWNKIQQGLPMPAFKALKYFISFLVYPVLKCFPYDNQSFYNPNVMGVYQKEM